MKFKILCHKCYSENLEVNLESDLWISEDDLYQFTCIRGHKNLVELQAFKFELLFESGLCAIRDKYYMECVLSITAAIERFYEFFIKTILRFQKHDEDSIESSFKSLSRFSERQLGAFSILYFQTFREIPPALKPTSVEFRNKVVHQGYIPNKNQVMEYAEDVYHTIKKPYLKLLTNYHPTIMKQQLDLKRARREKYKKLISESNISIIGIAPTLTLTHILTNEGFEKLSFKESFNTLVKNGLYL